MVDSDVERWCLEHNWTEPRQLEIGIWVAFPPGGAIETPIPLQNDPPKIKPLEYLADLLITLALTLGVLAIAIIMSPCFIEPIVKRYRSQRRSNDS